LQRSFAPILEGIDLLKCLEQRFLDKVVGIDHIAGPTGQPAGRPSAEQRYVTRKQQVHRMAISGSRLLQ
jgi:hypothetical protein